MTDSQFKTYADLIVKHGLNVQKGQIVQINAEVEHSELVRHIVRSAYQAGAKVVGVRLADSYLERIRIEESGEEDLSFVPPYEVDRMDYLLESHCANLSLVGPSDPDVLKGLAPERVNMSRRARRVAFKRFYDEGIGRSKVHWCVAAAATIGWAKRVFPDLEASEACEKLWQVIFDICRVNDPNCLASWAEHNTRLKERASKLNEMKLEKLHFTGPGTSLVVGLNERAAFIGGSDKGPSGAPFEPNVPTEEVFTTPDWRTVEGSVSTTRPFFINGVLIEDLKVEFKKGEISSFEARSGGETFEAYINSDPGARRLGEVALVGIDSPIYQSGLVFQEILFDENAACHIAIGSAYHFCIRDSEKLTPKELEEIGVNESCVHTDMMISSEQVDVVGTAAGGKEVELIRNGKWVTL